MANNTHTSKERAPINRRLFACIDRELYAPINMSGTAYFPEEMLFSDVIGTKYEMGYFYSKEIPLVCPMHQNQHILCRPYIEYASSLGFYCKECDIDYWSLSAQEIPCRECGVPVYHGSLRNYGICCQCDNSDDAAGFDFHQTDVIL
ncbi:hypothetical protein [Paraburkholderia agricolaris]|uniref:hypothetical protein n=1 Tax=Paraburkholderia agricolaris TaxID=2152888 RepID=UPI001291F40A|nr:hypothetical protein [Paraburkholderia agricolaris]